jgi:hypothetical protein
VLGDRRSAALDPNKLPFRRNVHMSEENPFTLHKVDLARADFYAIADDLDFVKAQLARIPTRKELARTAPGIHPLLGCSRDRMVGAVLEAL